MLKSYTKEGKKYGVLELVLEGPAEGNPFVEQWVKGSFSCDAERKDAEGFYDGDGIYRLRFMPSFAMEYRCLVSTSWGETQEVKIPVGAAKEGNHGPVRVADTFHFAYEDGAPYYPVGTTCYVWELQDEKVREETLRSLEAAHMNKLRFCIFPKHYVYNLREPERYPFERKPDAPWAPEDYSEKKLKERAGDSFNSYERLQFSIEEPEKVWDFPGLTRRTLPI